MHTATHTSRRPWRYASTDTPAIHEAHEPQLPVWHPADEDSCAVHREMLYAGIRQSVCDRRSRAAAASVAAAGHAAACRRRIGHDAQLPRHAHRAQAAADVKHVAVDRPRPSDRHCLQLLRAHRQRGGEAQRGETGGLGPQQRNGDLCVRSDAPQSQRQVGRHGAGGSGDREPHARQAVRRRIGHGHVKTTQREQLLGRCNSHRDLRKEGEGEAGGGRRCSKTTLRGGSPGKKGAAGRKGLLGAAAETGNLKKEAARSKGLLYGGCC
eukprot:365509-Chlamydomonas_euryale.AAC.6